MTGYEEICGLVAKITGKYGTNNPEMICAAAGIRIFGVNLGTEPDAIKGFFQTIDKIRAIIVNADLPEVVQRIILAHELGHAFLHEKNEGYAFHDVSLFDTTSQCEKEANIFAAELLLGDTDVMEALRQGTTFFSVASELRVPVGLLVFKIRALKQKGYALNELPLQAKNNFLKDMEVPENDDYHIS